MGGADSKAVSKDTKVSKEQALSAIADAFEGTPRSGVVAIEDIVYAAVASAKIRPTRLDRWKTTTSDMHAWSLKAHHAVSRSPRPNPDNPFAQSGRLLAGSNHESLLAACDMKILSGTTLQPSISWKAALDAAPMSRDTRLGKVRVMFEALDLDGNNAVTEDDFVSAMADNPEGVLEKEARVLFRKMDDSRTGRLTVAKFDHYAAIHTLAIVRDSFKSIDASKDRQMQRKEFAMYFMGNGLSKSQVGRLWAEIDWNGNGKVNFTEYRDWALAALEGKNLHQVAASLGLSTY